MAQVPTYFPKTAQELASWRRVSKSRTILDEMDQLVGELSLSSEDFRLLCSAYDDEDAVYGSLVLDDFKATELAREVVKTEEGAARYPLLAASPLKEFSTLIRKLRAAKRRHGMTREDMRARATRAGGAAA